MKIAFIIYNGFSTLDLANLFTPLTQLQCMNLLPDLSWDICAKHADIFDWQGFQVYPTRVNQPLTDYDLVIIPGSLETQNQLKDKDFLSWISSAAVASRIASVSNGTLLLAAAGLLKGRSVASVSDLSPELFQFGAQPLDKPIVKDNGVFTAASLTSSLDLGLMLCAQLAGQEAADKIRSQLENKPKKHPSAAPTALRRSQVTRQTGETNIDLKLNIDGSGKHRIDTGLPFLDHMLTQIAVHGLFDLEVAAQGDLQVDPHHTIEDIALALGQAFQEALGDRVGIVRMSSAYCPMDESLGRVSVDFSGRPYAVIQAEWHTPMIGSLPPSLLTHFLESFAGQARCNLHVRVLYGEDDHHQAEAIFKALGRAMDAATQIDPRRAGNIPSSKGILF